VNIIQVCEESFDAMVERHNRYLMENLKLKAALRSAADTMFAHSIGNWEECEALLTANNTEGKSNG
jgi:hypothetical protein